MSRVERLRSYDDKNLKSLSLTLTPKFEVCNLTLEGDEADQREAVRWLLPACWQLLM